MLSVATTGDFLSVFVQQVSTKILYVLCGMKSRSEIYFGKMKVCQICYSTVLSLLVYVWFMRTCKYTFGLQNCFGLNIKTYFNLFHISLNSQLSLKFSICLLLIFILSVSYPDVALVTSLRDGMNLVSYEFVACQDKKKGVLILSEVITTYCFYLLF